MLNNSLLIVDARGFHSGTIDCIALTDVDVKISGIELTVLGADLNSTSLIFVYFFQKFILESVILLGKKTVGLSKKKVFICMYEKIFQKLS